MGTPVKHLREKDSVGVRGHACLIAGNSWKQVAPRQQELRREKGEKEEGREREGGGEEGRTRKTLVQLTTEYLPEVALSLQSGPTSKKFPNLSSNSWESAQANTQTCGDNFRSES